MKIGSHRALVPLLALLIATGCAAAPPDAPRILYFGHFSVQAGVFHNGRIRVERSFEHPGINNIVAADIAGNLAVLLSLDPTEGGADGGMRAQFVNLSTGERERVLSGANSNDWVMGIALAPDGKMAALGFCARARRCRIEMEDLSTGHRQTILESVSMDSNFRWSPDGRRIAFLAEDGVITIYDLASGRLRKTVSGLYPAWSPTGDRLALATRREIKVVYLSDLSQTTLHRQPDSANPLNAAFVSWSSDGRYISFNSPGFTPSQLVCKVIDLTDGSVVSASRSEEFCGPWLPMAR